MRGVGRKTKETDSLGAVTLWDYHQEAGYLVRLTDANGDKITYGYDSEGRLTFETRGDPVQTGDGPGLPTWKTTYDEMGNRATIKDLNGTVVTFHYDADKRLTTATTSTGTYKAFHDSNGQRVREARTAGGSTIDLDVVRSGQRVLEVFPKDRTIPIQRFVYGRGIDEVVLAEMDPSTTGTTTALYPLEDELGNVTHLTDQSGAVVERYQYEGYGKFRIFDPSNSPRTVSSFGWNRLFQGREYLGVVDAYDFRARILWPEIGRFGQEDPIKAHPDLSLYEALGGNWTGRTDPRGLDWTPQARLQQRELVADLARFKASAGEGLRAIVGAFSRNVGGVYNPADRLAASLPDVANLRYYFEEEVIEDYGVEWSNYVLSHLEDRLQSFSAAWDRAKPQNHDNVYFDEEAGRFALFDREAFETSYGVTGLVSTGFDVFVAAGATGEARRANAGYEVGPAPRLNGNSLENPLDTHVYAIYGPDGLWKIGESSQGVRKRDGRSKRAEKQTRRLEKKTGQRFESFMLREFSGKAAGRAYETQLIQRYTRRFGRPPGNPLDR